MGLVVDSASLEHYIAVSVHYDTMGCYGSRMFAMACYGKNLNLLMPFPSSETQYREGSNFVIRIFGFEYLIYQ
jgi:hypothetical protein